MLHEVMEQQTLSIAKTGIISRLTAGLLCLRQGQLLADAGGPGLPVPHYAYVDIRRVGSGRRRVTARPVHSESLIRLAEAHAKMRLSALVDLPDERRGVYIAWLAGRRPPTRPQAMPTSPPRRRASRRPAVRASGCEAWRLH